eukprot:318375-Rhodomonas_salina.1
MDVGAKEILTLDGLVTPATNLGVTICVGDVVLLLQDIKGLKPRQLCQTITSGVAGDAGYGPGDYE